MITSQRKDLSTKEVLEFTLLFTGVLTSFLFSGCDDTEIKSKRISNPIVVDGNLKEWGDNTFTSFEDNSFKLAALNDKSFYYLGCEILERKIGRIFALSGITLVINPDGDKKKSIEMNFTYPGTKQIDYNKAGFFQVLRGDQKIKVLRNLEPLNNAVCVIDTGELKSLFFTESEDADFQGKIRISDNKLFFEIKIPIQINNYFETFNSLNKQSMFCLTPGTNFAGRQFNTDLMDPFSKMNNNKNGKQEKKFGKPVGFDRGDPFNLQYWFSIKTDDN